MEEQSKNFSSGNQITLDVQNGIGDCHYVYIYRVMTVNHDGISRTMRCYFSEKDAEDCVSIFVRFKDLYCSVFVVRDLCFV